MNQKGALVLLLLSVIVTVGVAQLSHKSGHCPMRHTVTKCMPRCMSDHQCHFDHKCCPNSCGHSSCVSPSAVNTGNDGGYKGSGHDSGVYCAGVRCSAYERCEFDRYTKREKCSRT